MWIKKTSKIQKKISTNYMFVPDLDDTQKYASKLCNFLN